MTLIGQGLGQMSFTVCVWDSEADGLSPMGPVWDRFTAESRKEKVARWAKPAWSSPANEQTTLEESGNRYQSHRLLKENFKWMLLKINWADKIKAGLPF